MIDSILDDVSFTDSLMHDALNGSGIQLNRVFRYAQDHYTYGLPSGHVEAYDLDESKVKAVLEGIEGKEVTLTKTDMDYGDIVNFITTWLTANRGYEITTGTLEPTANISTIISNEITAHTTTANAELSNDAVVLKTNIENTEPVVTTTSSVELRGEDYYVVEVETTITQTKVATINPLSAEVGCVDEVTYNTVTSYVSDDIGQEYTIHYDYTLNYDIDKQFDVSVNVDTVQSVKTTETLSDASGNYLLDGEGNPVEQVESTVVDPVVSTTESYVEQVLEAKETTGTDTEVINIPSIVTNHVYIHVQYFVTENNVRVNKSWDYDLNSGVHPTLNIGSATSLDSPFFPVIPLRRNNVDLTADSRKSTELYITSRKLLKKIDLDIDNLADGVNGNPDVKDIDHAYVLFGVTPNTENEGCIRYMAEFFENLSHNLSITKSAYDLALNPPAVPVYDEYGIFQSMQTPPPTLPGTNVIRMSDAGLRTELLCHYVDVQTVEGNLGSKRVQKNVVILPEGTIQREEYYGDVGGWITEHYERSYLEIKVQVSPSTYKRIEVRGLQHLNYVYDFYKVTSKLGSNGLFIPLQKNVVDKLPLLVRNHMYRDSVHMVFNSHVSVKVKWYQSGFFSFVMQAFSFYMMITSGINFMMGFKQALAQGVSAALNYVVKKVIISIALSAVFKIVVKAVGADVAVILGTIAAVTGLTKAIQAGSIEGAPWAEELLMLASGLGQAATKDIQNQLLSVKEESELFEKDAKDKMDALKSANELLDTKSLIDPFRFIDPIIIFNPDETPEEFYNRTVHSGNVGAMVFDAITHYVDSKLELPRNKRLFDSETTYA